MQNFSMSIVKGLLTILPIALTTYLLVWLGITIENVVAPQLRLGFYFPGLGIIITILGLALLGMLVNMYLVKTVIKRFNRLLEKLPVIKTLFGAISDAVELFNVSKDKKTKQAVLIEVAPGMKLVGFITGEKATNLLFPNENSNGDQGDDAEEKQGESTADTPNKMVAVYIPMSYQIGGYTLYTKRENITELDISSETAMRIAITGGTSISPPEKKS